MEQPKLTRYQANPATFAKAHRTAENIDRLLIHTMEGTYDGTRQWFEKGATAASHYCIARDGRIAQFVDEADIAYHAANWDYNVRSIGIELEAALDAKSQKLYGFPPNDFPIVMLGSLVELSRWILERYSLIIPDRRHIIGHNEVPDPRDPTKMGGAGGHQDPGQHFKWDEYMSSIQ
jgi:N-acetyl-anhydromuramyl-L-alanine amidase AmpD